MSLIKKNIWLVFYIILLCSVIATGFYIQSSFKALQDDLEAEQKGVSRLLVSSIRANLEKYESIIDVLSGELIRGGELPGVDDVTTLLSVAYRTGDEVIDVVLLKPDGTFVVSIVWPTLNGVSNIRDFPPAETTFQQTLKTEGLVLGRSYYSSQLKRMAVPIRKAIRDDNGAVLFVISLLVDVNQLFGHIAQLEQERPIFSSSVFRDFDNYYQFATPKSRTEPEFYYKPVDTERRSRIMRSIAHDLELPFEQIQYSGKPFSSVINDINGSYLVTFHYIDEYGLWQITETRQEHAVRLSAGMLAGPIGSVIFFIIIIFLLFRVVEKSQQNKFSALQRQANRDFLTGLYNRFYLENEIEFKDQDQTFHLIFLDLDRFKAVNDAYGHGIGDQVLIQVSRRLQKLIKHPDCLVRYSGDEFIIVARNAQILQIEGLCKKLLNEAKRPFVVEQYEFFLSASIGVASYPKDSTCLGELIRHADLAMYESKKRRDAVSFFSEFDKTHLFSLAQIEYEIKHALDKDELFLVYQPQVNEHKKVVGVEALIRWQNDNLGFVPPDKLIAVAEANGYMEKIGSFVIEEALKTIHEVRRLTNCDFSLSINVSVKQLQNKDFLEHFVQLTESYGELDALNLILEVTENVFIDNVGSIKRLLVKLREKGVRIALDDFGTGYSSLSLLAELPLDELKLDKAFIDPVTDDPKALAMITSILSIAKALELQTVAEGVEAKEQHDLLCGIGCDSIQGYYHSRPVGKQELIEFISSHC
ncbi:EAL domain-containing protein [Neiella marina]|uniref:EAL domain-containing protein n=1 Tax=Neiella holothuriorum TaxID=2870530 RepID=A0ABS7EE37_9GAMM|nr:EAL domain-containing protein [Neiella holothuriorum]MBW8190484.1 EAL domain-containing protein [Neiella holothuriorum]